MVKNSTQVSFIKQKENNFVTCIGYKATSTIGFCYHVRSTELTSELTALAEVSKDFISKEDKNMTDITLFCHIVIKLEQAVAVN